MQITTDPIFSMSEIYFIHAFHWVHSPPPSSSSSSSLSPIIAEISTTFAFEKYRLAVQKRTSWCGIYYLFYDYDTFHNWIHVGIAETANCKTSTNKLNDRSSLWWCWFWPVSGIVRSLRSYAERRLRGGRLPCPDARQPERRWCNRSR